MTNEQYTIEAQAETIKLQREMISDLKAELAIYKRTWQPYPELGGAPSITTPIIIPFTAPLIVPSQIPAPPFTITCENGTTVVANNPNGAINNVVTTLVGDTCE